MKESKNKNTDRNSPVVMSGTLDEGTLGFNYPQSLCARWIYYVLRTAHCGDRDRNV
jgi:hypothetical protein